MGKTGKQNGNKHYACIRLFRWGAVCAAGDNNSTAVLYRLTAQFYLLVYIPLLSKKDSLESLILKFAVLKNRS